MPNQRLTILFDKYIKNELPPDELREFWNIINRLPNKDFLTEELRLVWDRESYDRIASNKQEFFEKILSKAKEQEAAPLISRRSIPWYRIAAAAVILIAISVTVTLSLSKGHKKQVQIARATDVKAPDKSRATITLANGQTIYLDSAANGTLTTQNNVSVTKTADGKIIYSGEASEIVYNTLNNPRGSKVIDMTLVDGSRVWLNAGSSVTYPVAFAGNERKVSMTGEAYFEIKHDEKMPFTVSVKGMEVNDLGTEFNINAYDDEPAIKTTLVSGSAKVTKAGHEQILSPGQQVRLNSYDQFELVSNADIQQAIAWKQGYFQFSSTDIEAIMRQISRWYNVDVVYEKKTTQGFNGRVPTTVNVSDIFKILEATGWVHFQIEGNKITVKE